MGTEVDFTVHLLYLALMNSLLLKPNLSRVAISSQHSPLSLAYVQTKVIVSNSGLARLGWAQDP